MKIQIPEFFPVSLSFVLVCFFFWEQKQVNTIGLRKEMLLFSSGSCHLPMV